MEGENTDDLCGSGTSRRLALPEAFIATEECLSIYERIVKEFEVHPKKIADNVRNFGIFSGTEPLLTRLVKLGCNRQTMHEVIKRYSFEAFDEVIKGNENPLANLLANDRRISKLLDRQEIDNLLDVSHYIGNSKIRSNIFLKTVVNPILLKYNSR